MLKQLLALVLFTSFVFPQNGDSLLIQNNQSKFDTSLVEVSDTLFTSDTTKTKETIAKADSLIPIQGAPLTEVSTIISKNTFLFENYRYTGDLLRSFNLNFIKDLGFVGYPNETFIYGVGNGAVSYMLDGVLWNNRYTNSLDLNMVQSEDIDSIEIVPSPRGFLYGPYNNPVTVNFITRDFIVPVPYARIKYYQGPNAEAMIDGRFSALLAKRWNLSFEVTNRSIDSTYTNTAFSFWQVNAKLKYYLSNSVNITGWYYYVDTKQGLNGGVNVDSIANIPSSYNVDLYSPEAPVLFPIQKLDVLQNNFGLRALAKPFDNSQLDLSIYYRYNQDELRGGNDTANYKQNWEIKSAGGNLKYNQKSEFLNFDLLATYEKNNLNQLSENYFQTTNQETNDLYYSIGAILSGNFLNNAIVPSVFYKYDNKNFGDVNTLANQGYGLDLKIIPIKGMSLYIGLSKFNQLEDNDGDLLELGWNLQSKNLELNIKYFEMNDFVPYIPDLWALILTGAEIGYPVYSTSGIGFTGSYKFWVLLIDANCSYYIEPRVSLPEFQFVGGLFVNDLFFDDNLNLKAGFKFYYTGEIEPGWYWLSNDELVEPTSRLDFTLAGEIKKVAIFYFIWENLLYNEYYITPYYPMPDGNIRFGIAWELFN